jgi:hypothetical protein
LNDGRSRRRILFVSDQTADAILAAAAHAPAAFEYTVNFGIVAGRDVTRHELERLGQALLEHVSTASITSETRLEVGAQSAGLIHQVRVEIGIDKEIAVEADLDAFRRQVVDTIEHWLASSISGISGQPLEDAELEARDAVVEIVHGELYPRPPQERS